MKLAIMHPIRHHAYSVLKGLMLIDGSANGYFGFFAGNDVIDNVVKFLSGEKSVKSYSDTHISNNTCVNKFIKIMFLIFKKNKRFWPVYNWLFQKWCNRFIDKYDGIYFLQDYCNDLIRKAKGKGKIIIYDQIIAFNYEKYITGVEYDPYSSKKMSLEIENLLMADLIIVPSKFVYKSLMGYRFSDEIKDKIHMIPYGANIERKESKKKHVSSRLKILTVASLCRRKGFEYIINAMEEISKRDLDVRLTVVGIIDGKQGQEILTKIKKARNISYAGSVPHSIISSYYRDSDVFLLPSLAEGSALAVYEAMAEGLPCIVTEETGSTVNNYVEGLIINSKSAKEIVDAIDLLYNNRNLVEKMGQAAQLNAQKYSAEYFSHQCASIIAETYGI